MTECLAMSDGIMWNNWTSLLNICNCDPTMDYPMWPISCPSTMACQYCKCKNSTASYNGGPCSDSVCSDDGWTFCMLRAGQRVNVSAECPSQFPSCWQCGYGELDAIDGTCQCRSGFTGQYCETVQSFGVLNKPITTTGQPTTAAPTRRRTTEPSNAVIVIVGLAATVLIGFIIGCCRYQCGKSDCTDNNPARSDATPVQGNHANVSLSYYGSTGRDVPTHSTHPGSSHDGLSSIGPTPDNYSQVTISPSPTAPPNEENDHTIGISVRRESVPPTYENAVLYSDHHPPSRQESMPPTYEQAIQKC